MVGPARWRARAQCPAMVFVRQASIRFLLVPLQMAPVAPQLVLQVPRKCSQGRRRESSPLRLPGYWRAGGDRCPDQQLEPVPFAYQKPWQAQALAQRAPEILYM